MTIKLYVGNLAYSVRDDELRNAFTGFGEVTSATVLMDRDNPNRSRGFGFVEMSDRSAGEKAIAEMNGAEIDGRAVKVNEAQARS